MYLSHKKQCKTILAIGLILLIGLMLTSCMERILNQPPVAVISIVEGAPYGSAPQTFVFDISDSHDPDGDITLFVIDFGDGTDPIAGTDVSKLIHHTYESAGQYPFCLTVTDNLGKENRLRTFIDISEPIEEND
jgi:hypothetical protein